MSNPKLPAFTIMEVVIAMILSAILVTITYTAYGIISRSFGNFTKRNSEMMMLLRLDDLLRKDFSRAGLITGNETTILFNNRQDTISYTFNKDYILRKGGITDTFKVSPTAVQLNFENEPLAGTGAEPDTLDDLYLPVIYQNEKITLHYHKNYSSADLFKNTPNASN